MITVGRFGRITRDHVELAVGGGPPELAGLS